MSQIKRELEYSKRFLRAYSRYIGKDKKRRACIHETLHTLCNNPSDDSLKTHPLKGELKGFFACSCGYDCRIVFALVADKKARTEKIVLIDVGTHDDVY